MCESVYFTPKTQLCCVFASKSTLKERFSQEKADLQQSIHKNSALISEKDLLVENLRSEVRIEHYNLSEIRFKYQISRSILAVHHFDRL